MQPLSPEKKLIRTKSNHIPQHATLYPSLLRTNCATCHPSHMKHKMRCGSPTVCSRSCFVCLLVALHACTKQVLKMLNCRHKQTLNNIKWWLTLLETFTLACLLKVLNGGWKKMQHFKKQSAKWLPTQPRPVGRHLPNQGTGQASKYTK